MSDQSPVTLSVTLKIGVLAIQGAFSEHKISILKATKTYQFQVPIELSLVEVREKEHLHGLDGLIIPGGESTTMGIFLESNGLTQVLREWVKQDKSRVVWGTCAGLILLSNEIDGQKHGGQTQIGGLDVTTSRNFFGRQLNSFEGVLDIKDAKLQENFKDSIQQGVHGVFIRAPAVLSANNPAVNILATVNVPSCDKPVIVGVSQGNVIGTAFHPELTEDPGWHAYFLREVVKAKLS